MGFFFSVVVLAIIALTLIGIGIYLIYSAVTGRGVPNPGENSLKQMQIGFKLREVLGIPAIIFVMIIMWGVIQGFGQ